MIVISVSYLKSLYWRLEQLVTQDAKGILETSRIVTQTKASDRFLFTCVHPVVSGQDNSSHQVHINLVYQRWLVKSTTLLTIKVPRSH